MLHYILTGLSKSLPYGIEAQAGLRDYRSMFYFLGSGDDEFHIYY